eukprot:TRINITY_DN3179_c1_g6_i1.p1 TRINITY_DN3179_c1_g6~~TRINITY_DN3179_c1_g6_i1.p1  ORF type:complete len:197 (+),score=21.19 TRINITY_DN3179_c1_g6_i1:70-591(+)
MMMTPQSILVMFAMMFKTCMAVQSFNYTQDVADEFVGAQHWYESGYFRGLFSPGFKQHYSGYHCTCSCNATDEGIICVGGRVEGADQTFSMSVWGQTPESRWAGDVLSYDGAPGYEASFSQECPTCGANYTGKYHGPAIFRGYTSGINCHYRHHCPMCAADPKYIAWSYACTH